MRYLPNALCCILALAGCAAPGKPPAAGGRPVAVIAHRGASADAPENTLPAFERAADLGADWFELDVRLTAENRPIVFHDGDLERVTGRKDAVNATPFEAMRALDVGAVFGHGYAELHPPTLDESLEVGRRRGIGVYVEIKSSDDDAALHRRMAEWLDPAESMTEPLAEALDRAIAESGTRNIALTEQTLAAIAAADLGARVVVQSFSPVICWLALRQAPGLRVEFLGSDDAEKPAQWKRFVHWGRLMGVHGFNAQHEGLSAERIAQFHAWGATVAAWTVDDPDRMRALAAMGADAIITNAPGVARAALAAR